MAAPRAASLHKTPKRLLWTAGLVLVASAVAYALFSACDPLRVQVLDVSGYTDDVKIWMPFRVNLGLTNGGRDPIVIRRVHVEPDFDAFNEAFSPGMYELEPPLRIEPGQSLTYQASVTLLNAIQLPETAQPLVLRVRIEQEGEEDEQIYEFPAEFVHARDPAARSLRW